MDAVKANEFRSILESKKAELVGRLAALSLDKKREKGIISADFEEQAVDVQNDEVVDSLEGIERKELGQVEAALARIEAGSFGKCIECGDDISDKRLSAIPFSSVCMSCISE